ncbi:MAG: hypothetical protein Q9169_007001 [Polycauliona sp. 2 TL-2023]
MPPSDTEAVSTTDNIKITDKDLPEVWVKVWKTEQNEVHGTTRSFHYTVSCSDMDDRSDDVTDEIPPTDMGEWQKHHKMEEHREKFDSLLGMLANRSQEMTRRAPEFALDSKVAKAPGIFESLAKKVYGVRYELYCLQTTMAMMTLVQYQTPIGVAMSPEHARHELIRIFRADGFPWKLCGGPQPS